MKIADGEFTWGAGKGSISVLPDLSLSFVLHVPCFSFNLRSVSSLTKHLNCSVTYYRSQYVFEDLKMGQMIGGDHENNGLYLLDPTKKEPKVLQSPISEEDEV